MTESEKLKMNELADLAEELTVTADGNNNINAESKDTETIIRQLKTATDIAESIIADSESSRENKIVERENRELERERLAVEESRRNDERSR